MLPILVLVKCLATSMPGIATSSDLPLLHKNDLVYVGAFRVPRNDLNGATFEYGGYAPAYNQSRNTLFLVGHRQHQLTAEISIPNITASNDLEDLATADFLQPFVDATAGMRRQVNPSNKQAHVIGGQLVVGDQLLVNVYSTYDTRGSQRASLFIRSTDLGADRGVTGPYSIGSNVHLTSAYLARVPTDWQNDFQGTLLTGNCCRSIVSFQSHGPAISVFDPPTDPDRSRIAAKNLLRYDSTYPLGPGMKSKNPIFNMTSEIEGIVFPGGTDSILFFGRHGLGDYCYGEADVCGDKAMVYKGNHAYPYVYQVWAYRASDLAQVRRSRKNPRKIEPYDVWEFNLPFETDNTHSIGGVAYDSESKRLFLVQLKSERKKLPVVHVFDVMGSTPR